MNTPAHLVFNAALLGGGAARRHTRWILAGALLPDLPMFGFFALQVALGASQAHVWSVAYFEPAWQTVFDLFNSIPLALAAWAAARLARRPGPALLCASALLHQLLDLPLHREDGHRHFVPFSEWRFISPVSYWDPAHYGLLASLVETVAVVVASVVLWRRHPGRAPRGLLVGLCALSLAGWAALFALGS